MGSLRRISREEFENLAGRSGPPQTLGPWGWAGLGEVRTVSASITSGRHPGSLTGEHLAQLAR